MVSHCSCQSGGRQYNTGYPHPGGHRTQVWRWVLPWAAQQCRLGFSLSPCVSPWPVAAAAAVAPTLARGGPAALPVPGVGAEQSRARALSPRVPGGRDERLAGQTAPGALCSASDLGEQKQLQASPLPTCWSQTLRSFSFVVFRWN